LGVLGCRLWPTGDEANIEAGRFKAGADADEDPAKAIWYLQRERERLKRRVASGVVT
jgi:hypothetical protein